jgi:glutamate formiminotransferase/formiminotetrahydrofolate cyclodeaminase
MSEPIVECIPNFSEARRPQVIDSIIEAICSVPGVSLLDRHSDLDHNRTVLTFVGAPQAVEEAAFRAIARAGELIDLNQHTGEHPRIGATDVVPFVPIAGVTMQECVALARRLGQRVGEELGIPVYLYEQAATRPERQNLEDIRRGQYEALKVEIATHPERAPDFGPAQVGPAGATVIGARHPLIAFNVYLTSDDVTVARKIARAIRHSSGGLRYVKGLGMLVEGRAQVSMNLTNYNEIPLARVVEMIRREAARYGMAIHHSELVGLIPQQALVDAAQWYLQLDQFKPDQVLEQRLTAARGQAPVPLVENAALSQGFLDAVAAPTPTPGGGSAAAYSAAAAAALVAMVARLTIGKKKYAAVEVQMQVVLERAEALRASLTNAIQQDAAAFEALMTAIKLPKETPDEQADRERAVQSATLHAAQVPLEVAGQSVEVLELAAQVVAAGNLNAISDGATGAALAQAALRGAGYNVRINLSGMDDQVAAQDMLEKLHQLERRAKALEKQVQAELTSRGGILQA